MLGHAPIAGAPIASGGSASSFSAQYVNPSGDIFTSFGDLLCTWTQIVLPVGFAAGAIGAPTASWRQYVTPSAQMLESD